MSGRRAGRSGHGLAATADRTSGTGGPTALQLARLDLRTDRSGTLSLAILLLVTTLLAAAAPVIFTRAADAALPAMVVAANPLQRDLAFTLDGWLEGSPGDPMAAVRAVGERVQATMPSSLTGLISSRVDVADTVDMTAIELGGDGFTASLRLRAQPGIEDSIRFVRGRAPAAGGPPFEIAVSTVTAIQLRRDVGDAFTLEPSRGTSVPVRIVGAFEASERADPLWADSALLAPSVTNIGDGDLIDVHGIGLMATSDLPSVLGSSGGPSRYAWRFLLDWQALDARVRETLAADIAALRVQYPFRGSTEGSDVPSVSTGLVTILERYAAERAAAQAAMTLALVGPAAAAVGALGMIAATIARRRHGIVLLVRARGATDRQVVLARFLLAVVVVVPSTVIPAVVVTTLAGPTWAAGIALIAIAVAALTLALVVIATVQLLRGSAGALREARPAAWWGGPRSLVRDGLMLAVAVAGVIWISQRSATDAATLGAGGAGGGPGMAGADPLLVLVPTLVALTGGIIAWRCYLPLVRAGAAAAALHRGFVPVHALRGPSRGAGALQVPLVVLVVTIAIGVFGAVVLLSLQRQQELLAWRTVGAEYRVDSVTRADLPLSMASVPGVDAAADVVIRDGILVGGSARALAVEAAALDVEGYRRVVAGTPADGLLPEALWSTVWDETSGGTTEAAIPAVLVGEAARRPALAIGDTFELSALGLASHFRVAAILPEFPGATSPRGSVIVPLAAVKAADPERLFLVNQTFVRASPALAEAFREATVGSYGAPNVALVSRAAVRAAQEADPLVRDTSAGFLIALLVSIAFAALVVAVAVVRDVASRSAEIALLRALGTRPSQVLGVILVEQGTVVLGAVAGGLILGCAMGIIAVPGLGLDRFVEPGRIVDATIDWPIVSSVAVAQAAFALLVMVLATLIVRRRDPAPAMMRDA